MTKRRANGTGSVVKLRLGKDKATGEVRESRYWYVLYRTGGRQVRESSGSESKMVAEALLQKRLGEAGLGIRPQQDLKNIRYDDIRDALVAEYRNRGAASLFTRADGSEYVGGMTHLDNFFKGMRVTSITSDTIRKYIEARRKAGAQDATIRRQLVLLRSMLNLARKEGKLRLADIPHFPMPPDSKPRQGFVDPDVFAQIRAALPENLRPLITFMGHTGCRLGAARKITWDMVSRDCEEVMLPGEVTKSGEPLLLPLVGEGLDEVAVMLKKLFRKDGAIFDATNLRKEWAAACHKLGLGVRDGVRYHGLTIHDLRRSALRNLIRAGVPENVAMEISGHKTVSVFRRYNITDGRDVREALIKVGEYTKAKERAGREVTTIDKGRAK